MKTATPSADAASGLRGASRAAGSAAQLRVLLVDDCSVNRSLVTAVMARWGIVPTEACNGAEAVLLAGQQAFDFILMDILMPVMDGVVATAKIRQAERERPHAAPVPIVAHTSLDLGNDPAQWTRVGLSGYLPKPCSPTTLQACLTQCCPDQFRAGRDASAAIGGPE